MRSYARGLFCGVSLRTSFACRVRGITRRSRSLLLPDLQPLQSLQLQSRHFTARGSGMPKDHAITPDGPSLIIASKRDCAQRRSRAAVIASPGRSTVLRPNDNSIQSNCGGLSAGCRYSEKVAGNSAHLDCPVLSAIGRVQDQAVLADCPALVDI